MASSRNIQGREMETFAGFPAYLKYDPQDLLDPELDTESVYARILIRLTHLQTMFFLERLLLLNGSLDEGNMLLFSFEMLTLTLIMWTHKDRFAAMRRNFEWLVSNALPFVPCNNLLIFEQAYGPCRTRRRYPLPGAAQPNVYRQIRQRSTNNTLKHHTKSQPFSRLSRLGAPIRAKWGFVHGLQGHYTTGIGSYVEWQYRWR